MRRQKNPISIAKVLGASSIVPGIAQKLREYRLKKLWAQSVGAKLAQKTMPQRLIGRALYVNVTAHPWLTELGFHKKEIIKRLNEETGENSVDEIVFKVGAVKDLNTKPMHQRSGKREKHTLSPVEKAFVAEIEAKAKGIKDEGLRRLILRTLEKSFSEES